MQQGNYYHGASRNPVQSETQGEKSGAIEEWLSMTTAMGVYRAYLNSVTYMYNAPFVGFFSFFFFLFFGGEG